MITDPRFAPRRTDLPWLRRRRRPRVTTPATAPAAPVSFARAPAPPAKAVAPVKTAPPAKAAPPAAPSAVADFVAGHASHHPSRPAPEPETSGSSSLDLDAPTAARPPAAPAAPSSSGSLDLDDAASPSPPAARRSASAASSSSALDLDDAGDGPSPPPLSPPSAPPRRHFADIRVTAGGRVIFSPGEPTATLTRLQTGIGTLHIEAACSADVGDLRLGCAYELHSGTSSTVQLTQGERHAPPGSRRPIVVGSHDRYEQLAIDLRQCRELRRLVVYAFSEARRPLTWGGTLIVTTFGGGRIELPLEPLRGGDLAALLSIYNVGGEFVLRAEMQVLNGDVREVAREYGFDRITWLDARTPVT